MSAAVAEFVARIRAQRVAAGRPGHIDSPDLYRLLDGVVVAHRGGDRSGGHT